MTPPEVDTETKAATIPTATQPPSSLPALGLTVLLMVIICPLAWWWYSRPIQTAPVQSQPTVATTDLHAVTGTFPACPTVEDYDKLVGFMVEKDSAAAENQFNTANCINIRAGEQVYNEGVNISKPGIVGIRRQGEEQTYFTAIEAIK